MLPIGNDARCTRYSSCLGNTTCALAPLHGVDRRTQGETGRSVGWRGRLVWLARTAHGARESGSRAGSAERARRMRECIVNRQSLAKLAPLMWCAELRHERAVAWAGCAADKPGGAIAGHRQQGDIVVLVSSSDRRGSGREGRPYTWRPCTALVCQAKHKEQFYHSALTHCLLAVLLTWFSSVNNVGALSFRSTSLFRHRRHRCPTRLILSSPFDSNTVFL
jgi:hypothetical protein